MKKYARFAVSVCAIVTSYPIFANCPASMPEPLLHDCIVYENAGELFPTSDYAYKDLYEQWLKDQQSSSKTVEKKSADGKS